MIHYLMFGRRTTKTERQNIPNTKKTVKLLTIQKPTNTTKTAVIPKPEHVVTIVYTLLKRMIAKTELQNLQSTMTTAKLLIIQTPTNTTKTAVIPKP